MIALYVLYGCTGTRHLKEDEKLLLRQKIVGNNSIEKEELEELYLQETNSKVLLLPISLNVAMYSIGKLFYDTASLQQAKEKKIRKYDRKISKKEKEGKSVEKLQAKKEKKVNKKRRAIEEGNQFMRLGEPPTVLDSNLVHQATFRMERYMETKGFFENEVELLLRPKGKKSVIAEYHITEGEPYIIDTIFYNIPDSTIIGILKENSRNTHLKKGVNYDQKALSDERERIDFLLKDKGYFDFSRQYIDFDVDTAWVAPKQVAVRMNIRNPQRGEHKVFYIDSVIFITDAHIRNIPDSLRQNEYYQGTNFRYFENEYNTRILNRRLFVHSGDVYSRSNTINTQRQLANLDIFRFMNINYDSTGGDFIANVYVSPLDRYQLSNEVGLNVTQGVPGPFYNITLRRRNIFKGLELLELSGRIGIEGVAPATEIGNVYRSTEAGANLSITFPQFLLPISDRAKYKIGTINPRTRVQTGYAYTDRPEYLRTNINISNTYTWATKRNTLNSFTIADMSLINSRLDDFFLERLIELQQNGNNLINTFDPSFVSSASFSSIINRGRYGEEQRKAYYIRVFLESGGTTWNFLNPTFLENQGLEYFQFAKFNVDLRRNDPINRKTTMAYRINTGLAVPYSENRILPYEKYFFAGGSNGIRAWRPRRLGPGSYSPIDPETGLVNYRFEQQGELLIEGSVEFRQNLIGFIDYALFMDVGNIWTIYQDDNRPGAQFNIEDFWREFAVGTGIGIRFDFSFLVFRLDAGLKVLDPARPQGKRFILSEGFYDAPFTRRASEPVIFNIGVGYPF